MRLQAQVSRQHYPLKGKKKRERDIILPEDVAPGLRHRRLRAGRALHLEDKLDIAHRAIVGCEAQKDLAKEYRVSQVVVSLLICQVRKKPEYLAELIAQRTEKQQLELKLADYIEALMKHGFQIRTVKQVRDMFEAATSISLHEHQVRGLMKKVLLLSYKKIVRLAPQANSLENRI